MVRSGSAAIPRCVRGLLVAVAPWFPTEAAFTSEKALREHLLASYDKLTLPGAGLGPTNVSLTYAIASLWGIDQRTGQFSVDMYVRTLWTDPRLAYEALDVDLPGTSADPKLDFTTLIDSVWTPSDLFFANAVDTKQPKHEAYLHVRPSGQVMWSRRFILTTTCKMYFGAFPFDTQSCTLSIEMYGHTAHDVVFTGIAPTATDKGLSRMKTNEWHEFSEGQSTGITYYGTIGFSFAHIDFSMHRQSKFWVNNGIFSSILFVFVSYCGFWVDPAAAPGRIALSVICVLVLVTSSLRIASAMPTLAYSVWLLDYMTGCVMFSLAAVVLYCVVNYGRSLKAATKPHDEETGQTPRRLKCFTRMATLDLHMRWFFPLAFVVFNISMFLSINLYKE